LDKFFSNHKKILLIAAVGTLVAIFCTIPIPTKGTKKSTFNLNDILDPLEKSKILSVKDLIGIPLEITIVDKSEKPVSEAFLVLQSMGFIDSLKADHNGIVQLILTDTLIKMNPAIYARKDTIKLGTKTRLYGELCAGEKPIIIKVNEFLYQVKNDLAILYKPNNLLLVDTLFDILNKQKDYVITQLHLTPIPWGVILIDTLGSVILDRSHFVKDTFYFHLYPLKTTEGLRKYYIGGCRTYIKNNLLNIIKIPENQAYWVFNGLADFFTNRYLSFVPEEKRKTDNLYLYDKTEIAQINLFVKEKGRKSANILKWKPKSQIDWFYGFVIFYAFWEKVSYDYGQDAIIKFIQEVKDITSPSVETIFEILEKHTDKRVKILLESFPYSLVDSIIDYK